MDCDDTAISRSYRLASDPLPDTDDESDDTPQHQQRRQHGAQEWMRRMRRANEEHVNGSDMHEEDDADADADADEYSYREYVIDGMLRYRITDTDDLTELAPLLLSHLATDTAPVIYFDNPMLQQQQQDAWKHALSRMGVDRGIGCVQTRIPVYATVEPYPPTQMAVDSIASAVAVISTATATSTAPTPRLHRIDTTPPCRACDVW